MSASTTTTGARSEFLFSVDGLAADWRCATGLVYKIIGTGELRAIRIGRLIRIPESAVAEFIAAQNNVEG